MTEFCFWLNIFQLIFAFPSTWLCFNMISVIAKFLFNCPAAYGNYKKRIISQPWWSINHESINWKPHCKWWVYNHDQVQRHMIIYYFIIIRKCFWVWGLGLLLGLALQTYGVKISQVQFPPFFGLRTLLEN